MIEKKKIYYLTPALLTILIFASDFLSTDIFSAGYQNFSVWFVLSVFCFACGWLINKTLNYVHGGKIVFAVIVASSLISVVMISVFKDYFGLNDVLVENLILYILRNVILGAMAFFGMAISELMNLQKEVITSKSKQEEIKKLLANAEREAQLLLDESKLKADKMISEVQQNLNAMIDRKTQIERRLKEFIQAERELIKSYEKEEE